MSRLSAILTLCFLSAAFVNQTNAQSVTRNKPDTGVEYEILRSVVHREPEFVAFNNEVNSWHISPNGCPIKEPDQDRLGFFYSEGDGYIYISEKKTIPVRADCTIDVETKCALATFLINRDSTWSLEAGRIAYADAIRLLAKRYNVPASVIEPSLQNMESAVVRSMQKRLGQQAVKIRPEKRDDLDMAVVKRIELLERTLATTWNKYRSTSGREHEVPGLVYEPGCGAGAIKVTFRTLPPGGKLRLITSFDWRLCEARHRDPWDPTSCPGWTEVVQERINISGDYHYIADWDDGTPKKSNFLIEPGDTDTTIEVKR